MIKAVIFDWGGVIAPNPRGGWLNVLADKLGISVEDALIHWKIAGYTELSKGFIDEQTFWQRFEKSYGQSLPVDKDEIWIKGSALIPMPEMLAFAEGLKQQGLRVAILSNTVKPMSDHARAADLYTSFDPVVLSDEVGMLKPGTGIYTHILNKLDLMASECIYVDDLPHNLMPAVELGMHTVLADTDPNKTINDIQKLLKS